jgi:halogenation protein CepH
MADKEQSMVPLVKSSIVKNVMREGAKEQTRVLLGKYAGPETPLFAGCLAASPDGLTWSVCT